MGGFFCTEIFLILAGREVYPEPSRRETGLPPKTKAFQKWEAFFVSKTFFLLAGREFTLSGGEIIFTLKCVKSYHFGNFLLSL